MNARNSFKFEAGKFRAIAVLGILASVLDFLQWGNVEHNPVPQHGVGRYNLVQSQTGLAFAILQNVHANTGATPTTSGSVNLTSTKVGSQIIAMATYSSGNAGAINSPAFSDTFNTYNQQVLKQGAGGANQTVLISSVASNVHAGTLSVTFSVSTTGSGIIELDVFEVTGLASATASNTGTFLNSVSPYNFSASGSITVMGMADTGSGTSGYGSSGFTVDDNAVSFGGGFCGHVLGSSSCSMTFTAQTQGAAFASFS